MDFLTDYISLLFSKKVMCLEKVNNFWRKKYKALESRSDEVQGMDSGNSQDHGIWPTDPQVLMYQKNKH